MSGDGHKPLVKIAVKLVEDKWIQTAIGVCKKTADDGYSWVESVGFPSSKVSPNP